MNDIPCPCCGFLTFEKYYGSFDICSVCGWEDDGVQLANPTSVGGANKVSLADAQADALNKYPLSLNLASGYYRAPAWRPLNATDTLAADKLRAVNHWHTQAIVSESEAYWQAID